jgi:catechol 2,3-dioxygenase-like lactoylglutathione lyase family enzyme
VKFYEFLGMKLLKKLEFPEAKFDLYFLGYDSPQALSHGNNLWDREGLIELTHNYGTQNDANYKVNNGNAEPHRGFGHTCIRSATHSLGRVPDVSCTDVLEASTIFKLPASELRMPATSFRRS